MPTVRTPQLTISFEEHGDGPHVLVLLHGNFGSPRWWRPLLERLPPGVRALMPVLRGCAGTLGTDGDYSVERLAHDLRDFAQALSLPPFHLVGHSLGGGVALQYALDAPASLASLTLVAPAPPEGLAALQQGGGAVARKLRGVDPEHQGQMRLLQGAFQLGRVLGTHRALLREGLRAMMPSANLPERDFDMLLHDAAAMSPEAFVGFARALARWNVLERLPALRVPTLLVAGGRDVLVPPEAMRRLAAALPGCRFVFWPDVGHAPQLERPDEFVRALLSFLLVRARSSSLLAEWAWRWLTPTAAGSS